MNMNKIGFIVLLFTISVLFSQFKGTSTVDYNPRNLLLNSEGDYSFFSMNNISIDHSFSMSYVSDSKNSVMQNEYVAGLNFKFSYPLKMRIELGAAYVPYSTYSSMEENKMPEVYLKSASLHYQISKNSHISIGYNDMSKYNNTFDNNYNNSNFIDQYNWFENNINEEPGSHQVKIGFE